MRLRCKERKTSIELETIVKMNLLFIVFFFLHFRKHAGMDKVQERQ